MGSGKQACSVSSPSAASRERIARKIRRTLFQGRDRCRDLIWARVMQKALERQGFTYYRPPWPFLQSTEDRILQAIPCPSGRGVFLKIKKG